MSSGFKYELTQILTLIYQAKKEQLLTDEERKIIKEHVISTEPDLTVEMEQYNSNKDLGAFVETLKLSAGITAMSSPLDSSLLKKKKDNQKKQKKKIEERKKKQEEKKVDVDEENIIAVAECELGDSPEIQPKTFKKRK